MLLYVVRDCVWFAHAPQLPVLLGQASQHDFLFFYNGKCNGNLPCAVRYGDYKVGDVGCSRWEFLWSKVE